MKRFFRRALLPMAAVAAVTVSTLPAEAYSFVPCNTSTTRVCYDEVGPTGLRLSLYDVAQDPNAIATVAAYYDVYNIPFGQGGVQVPCVTPIVNGVEAGTCARLGFQRIDRLPLVAEERVALVGLVPTQSVYVCEAELTVLVNNVGLNRFPILSACHDFMVE